MSHGFKRYLGLLRAEILTGLGRHDLLVGVTAALVSLGIVFGLLRPSSGATAVILITAGTFGLALFYLVFAGPYRVWGATDMALAQFTDRPDIRVELVPVLDAVPSLIRLLVTNDSPRPARIQAKVHSAAGIGSGGPEAPWPVPWRHSKRTATTVIYGGDAEMLLLARDEGHGVFVEVLDGEGEPSTLHPVPVIYPLRLRVHLYDAETGGWLAGCVVQLNNGARSARVLSSPEAN